MSGTSIRIALAALAIALLPAPSLAFDLQGHRGARGLAPENTLAGFAAALGIGVDTLELDVAVTADGVVVVSHNRRLNPDLTRGPDGAWLDEPGPPIRSLTIAELARYDVGRIKPGSRYAESLPQQQPVDGQRLPRLAEVFALVKRAGNEHVRFNIETKISPEAPDESPDPESFAAILVEAVRKAGMAHRVSIQSFDWRTLKAVNGLEPSIPTVCLSAEQRWLDNIQRGRPGASPWTAGLDIDALESLPQLVQRAGCHVWSPYYRDVDGDAVAGAHRLGLTVVPWTVDDTGAMTMLIDAGVDGLITDYPDRLRAVLAGKGIALPVPTPVGR